LLITGGGVYNDFLIKRMKALLPGTKIVIPDDKTIQFKEALIFALLGVLKLRGDNNVLSSVTGASRDHSSGVVFEA
jgi:anhydro-N-acetylmuramic acid kinase